MIFLCIEDLVHSHPPQSVYSTGMMMMMMIEKSLILINDYVFVFIRS